MSHHSFREKNRLKVLHTTQANMKLAKNHFQFYLKSELMVITPELHGRKKIYSYPRISRDLLLPILTSKMKIGL